jgi:hypothetical protein
MLSILLLIVLIMLIAGALPGAWPHSRDWGKGPISLLSLILIILLVVLLFRGPL